MAALFTRVRVREGARVGVALRLRSASKQDMFLEFSTAFEYRATQTSPAE